KTKGWILTDTENDRISVYSQTGKFANSVGEKTKGAGKEGILDTPAGLDMNEQGQFLVADSGKSRLVKYNAAGIFMGAFGPKLGNFSLSKPIAVAWGPSGSMLVLDAGLRKIVMLDQAGMVLNAWGGEGNELWNLKEPVAMVYDGKKFVYVLDKKTASVKAYDTNGKWLGSFFSPGKGRADLTEPNSLAYKKDKLYISEPERGRLSAYAVEINVAPPQKIHASAREDRALLTWDNPAEGLTTGYVIYRSTQPGQGYEQAAQIAELSFEEALAEQGGTYYYRLAAKSRTGSIGAPSQEIMLYVPGIPKPETLEIAKINIDHLFSAGYKYYVNNPAGTITVANNTGKNIMNAKVSFFLKDYTDFPYDTMVRKINAGEEIEVHSSQFTVHS
ncbi:MAG TPA: hypothetical protein PLL10_10505, partial [Elusimicrobiales bacterium]|nr:hypothetical protein [Elusimicrobiales bacterium]